MLVSSLLAIKSTKYKKTKIYKWVYDIHSRRCCRRHCSIDTAPRGRDPRQRHLIRLHSPQPDFTTAAEQTQRQRQGDHDKRQDSLEPQRALHVVGRASTRAAVRAVGQGAADEDEDAAEELTSRPADGGGDLGRDGMCNLAQVFQHDGDEGEGSGAQERKDGVHSGYGARRRRPNKRKIADRNDGDLHLDGKEIFLAAVDERACHG